MKRCLRMGTVMSWAFQELLTSCLVYLGLTSIYCWFVSLWISGRKIVGLKGLWESFQLWKFYGVFVERSLCARPGAGHWGDGDFKVILMVSQAEVGERETETLPSLWNLWDNSILLSKLMYSHGDLIVSIQNIMETFTFMNVKVFFHLFDIFLMSTTCR